MAVLFRINAQSEAHEEALTERGIPYVVRGAARFFDRPEVRQAVTLLRGTARSGEARRRPGRDGPRHARGTGLDDRAADRARAGPRPLGVLAGPGRPGDRVRRGGGHRPRRLRRRARPARRRAARPGRRRRHPHHPPRRQGPRVGRRDARRAPGRHPADHLRQHPRRARGGATAALRRHDPRPLGALAARGARPATRVAGQSRQPSPFLAGMLPASERPRPTGPARRRAVHCRECGKPLSTPAQKKIGRCADCPASYDEELFERLREWRRARAGDDGVPAFVVFTDATLQLIAEHKPGDEQGAAEDQRGGPLQAGSLRRRAARADLLTTSVAPSGQWHGFASNWHEMPTKSFASYAVRADTLLGTSRQTAHTVLARPAPDTPKEVAHVISNKTWLTAQTPSGFVMPISGAAFWHRDRHDHRRDGLLRPHVRRA